MFWNTIQDVNSIMRVFYKVIDKLEARKEKMDREVMAYQDRITYAKNEAHLAGKYLDNLKGMLEG